MVNVCISVKVQLWQGHISYLQILLVLLFWDPGRNVSISTEMQKNHTSDCIIIGVFGRLTSNILIVGQPVKGKSGNSLALAPCHDQLPHCFRLLTFEDCSECCAVDIFVCL